MANRASSDRIDWEAVEREYRSGQRTLSEIGASFGVSKGRISQVAKEKKWERDLSERIKAKAAAKLNEALLNKESNETKQLNDADRVDAGAQALANVILGHRADAKALRDKANQYRGELDKSTDNLTKRVALLKALVETQKTIIAMERQAFGIRDDDDGKPKDHVPLEDRLKKYAQDAAIEAAGNVTRLPRAA